MKNKTTDIRSLHRLLKIELSREINAWLCQEEFPLGHLKLTVDSIPSLIRPKTVILLTFPPRIRKLVMAEKGLKEILDHTCDAFSDGRGMIPLRCTNAVEYNKVCGITFGVRTQTYLTKIKKKNEIELT
jgi:hypothetical protein